MFYYYCARKSKKFRRYIGLPGMSKEKGVPFKKAPLSTKSRPALIAQSNFFGNPNRISENCIFKSLTFFSYPTCKDFSASGCPIVMDIRHRFLQIKY
jgi:hypothetical protein